MDSVKASPQTKHNNDIKQSQQPSCEKAKKAKEEKSSPSKQKASGYYDANLKMSCLLKGLSPEQSKAIPGPKDNGMPTYSGPHYPKITSHNPDPNKRLKNQKINPQLKAKVERLIENANRHGLNIVVTDGHRSFAQQQDLVDKGRQAGSSKRLLPS